MELKYRLLEHPFYQAWTRGDITEEQLSQYAEAYQKFMDRVPRWWSRIVSTLAKDHPMGEQIIDEEQQHAKLWARWRSELDEPEEDVELEELFETLEEMNPLQLAGALHAYEIQQPEVSETKKTGLLEHYGFDESDLGFFNEHIDGEEEHIEFGVYLKEASENSEEFEEGFRKGAEAVYKSLNNFV